MVILCKLVCNALMSMNKIKSLFGYFVMEIKYLMSSCFEIINFKEIIVFMFTVLVVSFTSGNEVPVIGFEGTSITLKCPLSVDDTSVIEWLDFVWNSDANHLIIFSSLENPDFQVAQSHPHKDNYRVGRDFSLTISDLNMDDDPGEYTCRSRTDGTELKIHYYLTVGGSNLARKLWYETPNFWRVWTQK